MEGAVHSSETSTIQLLLSTDTPKVAYQTVVYGATQWPCYLRHCTTSRKVTGSISDGVIEIFNDIIIPAPTWPWS